MAGPTNRPKNGVDVAREYRLTFAEVAELTISQRRLLGTGGVVRERTEGATGRVTQLADEAIKESTRSVDAGPRRSR